MVDRIEPTHEEGGDFSLKRTKKRKKEQIDEQQKEKRKEDEQLKKKTITTNMNEFSLKRSKKRKEEQKDEQHKKKRKEDERQKKTTITTNMNDFSLKKSKKRKEERKYKQQKKKRKEDEQPKKTTMTTNINDFSLERRKDEQRQKKRKEKQQKKKKTTNMNDFSLKKRKKKSTTSKKDFSLKPHVWTTNNKYLDDDLVVTQILTRLPAKSLMRFKSVCKSWKSIIEQDSHFINLHHTHSQARPPQLLTIVFDHQNSCEERRGCFDLLSADLDCDGGDGDVRGATIRSSAITLRSPSPKVKVLGPVRGLLCFADLANFDVMIYNVSTRQAVTPWIRSTVSLKKLPFFKPVCEFGFDLDSGEHKVIFVWHDSESDVTRIPACCEVLTVGVDASWRIIDAVPTREFCHVDRTYANGSVYWVTIPNNSILEFDMGSEKFRTIRIPRFVDPGKLIELDGCLTIVPFRTPGLRIQTLWTFHDRNKKKPSGEGEEWTAFNFELPPGIFRSNTQLHQIPGKDHIILETYTSEQMFWHNVKIARFFCYNKINNTFSEFRIRGIPSLPEGSNTCSKLLVEGLFHARLRPTSDVSYG
ncbi:Putative F-box protein At1g32420 [Linum grandiflorum]